jgi:excinuclease ABC subunit B
VNGKVILYANEQTQSIKKAVEITRYRRRFQERYNRIHGITPTTIVKRIAQKRRAIKGTRHLTKSAIQRQLIELDAKMHAAAARLDFETAIMLRDRIHGLEEALERRRGKNATTSHKNGETKPFP